MFNYCPDEVVVLLAGIIKVTGLIDGTFINIDKDVMPYISTRTSDGTVARLYQKDQTYTITLTLSSASDSNDLLTKLQQVDEITQLGKFPILVRDLSGSDLFFSATSWIEKIPSMTKSKNIDARVWTIRSSSAIINLGGNSEASSIINDIVNIATAALPAIDGVL